ncbi:MAG: hypothetical protein NC210_01330 [[Clostridium] fimetarium]|nr:hypothetical protein [Alistipes timonensis]MCM1405047.1 hypothetical protein [[Clostridium] fimetarium]
MIPLLDGVLIFGAAKSVYGFSAGVSGAARLIVGLPELPAFRAVGGAALIDIAVAIAAARNKLEVVFIDVLEYLIEVVILSGIVV